MWSDWINGLFELFGGLFILFSCVKLHRQKKIRGVSLVHVSYFAVWGYWNIHYYSNLDQWVSLTGSMTVTLINTFWLGQIIYYLRKEKHGNKNSIS